MLRVPLDRLTDGSVSCDQQAGQLRGCAERFNIVALRLLYLERPAYKVGPLLASGNLVLKYCSLGVVHCTLTVCFMLSNLLSFWEPGIFIAARQSVLRDQTP